VNKYILDVRDKFKLTETLVAQLPEGSEETVDRAMRQWWANIRKNGGMRLTDYGYLVFTEILDLERYSLEINPETYDRRIVLDLDRKLQSPYYIEIKKHQPRQLIMFGSREAVLARLYGRLDKFLENYK
jgi:hypothetical protein